MVLLQLHAVGSSTIQCWSEIDKTWMSKKCHQTSGNLRHIGFTIYMCVPYIQSRRSTCPTNWPTLSMLPLFHNSSINAFILKYSNLIRQAGLLRCCMESCEQPSGPCQLEGQQEEMPHRSINAQFRRRSVALSDTSPNIALHVDKAVMDVYFQKSNCLAHFKIGAVQGLKLGKFMLL